MTLNSILTALHDLPLAEAMRGGAPGTQWLFPIVETIHVLSLATVFGSIAMLDLRLLGVTARDTAVSCLSAEVLPWTWVAWLLAAISGSLLFVSKAVAYAGNFQFQMKFVFMALAGLNMVIFHLGAYRKVSSWDRAQTLPTAARLAGALSLGFWITVIFFARWVGFTT
jgi:hypothetical protein